MTSAEQRAQAMLAAALDTLGLTEQNPSPRFLGKGRFNWVYAIDDGNIEKAIRLNNAEGKDVVFNRRDEYQAHRFAAKADVAPKFYRGEEDFLLMELLEGVRHPVAEELGNSRILSRVVDAVKVVHGSRLKLETRKSLYTRSAFWYGERKKEGRLTEEVVQAWEFIEGEGFGDIVESYPTVVPGHADINPGNIALFNHSVKLFDFETAAMISPFMDLSRLCYSADSPEADNEALRLYFGEAGVENKLQLQTSLKLQAFVGAVFGFVEEDPETGELRYEVNEDALTRFWRYAQRKS